MNESIKEPIAGQLKVSKQLRKISTKWWADLLDELDEKGHAIALFSDTIALRVQLTDNGFEWIQLDVKRLEDDPSKVRLEYELKMVGVPGENEV